MNRQTGNYVIKITIRFIFRWNFIQHFKKELYDRAQLKRMVVLIDSNNSKFELKLN